MPKVSFATVETELIPFIESDHGKLRRSQRSIGKEELKALMKHGTRREGTPRSNGDPTAVYTYNGIVYIVNDITGAEVTSYRLPTELTQVPIPSETEARYQGIKREIQSNKGAWKSNTVVVVDTSGSMRTGDVTGSKTRLQAVWMTLANDYIFPRIEEGNGGWYDVVSIVSFSDTAEVVLLQEPTTWILYNKICKIHNNGLRKAKGHGHFLPGISKAEELLKANESNSACAMNLVFLSDGRPSDHHQLRISPTRCWDAIEQHIEGLSSTFGRRLNFSTIGIGNPGDFEMLKRMVDAACDYGAQAKFHLPSMSCASLGTSLTASATALGKTQIEMLDNETKKQRKRRPILTESRKQARKIPKTVSDLEFNIYPIKDVSREKMFPKERFDERQKKWHWRGEFEKVGLHYQKAEYVAMKKKALGEGAERFAFQFYEVAQDRKTIVGKPFVAKESCFILENQQGESSRRKFVETFCRTQQLTSRIANEFNEKLDSLRRVRAPRIAVLDCSVYHLKDPNQGEISVLVEPRLDHTKWKKWNSNNGYVADQEKSRHVTGGCPSQEQHLPAIAEEDDDDNNSSCSDDSEDNEISIHRRGNKEIVIGFGNLDLKLTFTDSDVAQAFSHFSYVATGEKRLICDIQGVHDEDTNRLVISDPAIHYYNRRKEHRKNQYGRSDLGEKGMRLFSINHKCSELCKLVTSGLRHPKYYLCTSKRSLAAGDQCESKKRRRFT